MLRAMFLNPVPGIEFLGLIPMVVLSSAIVGFVVGTAWLWRLTRVDEDGGDWWRFHR